jgi:TRAP-type mannitol/chloroaromatic compound transport system permease small subunit
MITLKKAADIFQRIITWCSEISSILILVCMLLIVVDVIGRFLFRHPLGAANETVEILMVAIVFLALAYTESKGKHIRIEFIEKWLSPRPIYFLNILAYIAGILIVGIIMWQGWEQAIFSASIDERIQSTTPLPLYPARFILVWGALLLVLEFLILLVKNIYWLGINKQLKAVQKEGVTVIDGVALNKEGVVEENG